MTFLGAPGDAIVRSVHIGAVILWIGLLHFAVFVRPRVLAGLSEGGMREVAPHLAARLVPWLVWAPLITLLSGVVLYLDMLSDVGFARMGWGIQLGALVAVGMVGLVHGVSLPGLRRAAAVLSGGPPPPPSLFRRLTLVGWVLVALSWVVLLLMVFSAHSPFLR